MGCFVVLVGLIAPRLCMALVFLLTDWFGRAYDSALWPILGFLFLPYTTLAYMAAMLRNEGKVDGLWIVIIVVAVLVDVGHLKGGGSVARKRRQRDSASS